mgnify:CR=1 FL=1
MMTFLIKTALAMLLVGVLTGAFFWHEIITKLTHETSIAFSDGPAGLCVNDEIVEGGYLPIKNNAAGGHR